MACSFGAELNLCEAKGCQREAEATYLVNEPKELCQECAQVKTRKGAVRLVDKEGVWYCEKHKGKRAENFCGTHRIAVCPPCIVADHQSCSSLKVVEDAAKEERGRLEELYAKGLTKREELMRADAAVTKATNEMKTHLQQQANAIKQRCQEMEEKVRGYAHEKNVVIDRETEKEVQKLRSLQEQRKRANHEEMEEEISKISEQRDELLSKIDEVAEAIKGLIISPTKTFIKEEHGFLNEGLALAESTLTSDKYTFTEGSIAQKTLLEIVNKITDTTDVYRAVKCTKGVEFSVGDSRDVGRIHGCKMKIWRFKNKIDLPDVIRVPRVKFLSFEEVAILDLTTAELFRVNLESMRVTKVAGDVADVVSMTNGKIAIIDKKQACIRIVTSEWDHQFSISFPPGCMSVPEKAKLTVDADSNLLVRISDRQIIHVFDPASGRKLRCIAIRPPLREIHDMIGIASGNIIVKKRRASFITVNSEGVLTNGTLHNDHWERADLALDRTTGTMYCVYLNKNTKRVNVEVAQPASECNREYVAGCTWLLDPSKASHCDVFSGTSLCVCNGNGLFIFKCQHVCKQ
ncbi:uncharacterized protein [Diadema antillarum]|uniref:uncharacterized protein n=1 Tax=Diadema antillarum TaxID=105358 RepID=UPI003A8C25BE